MCGFLLVHSGVNGRTVKPNYRRNTEVLFTGPVTSTISSTSRFSAFHRLANMNITSVVCERIKMLPQSVLLLHFGTAAAITVWVQDNKQALLSRVLNSAEPNFKVGWKQVKKVIIISPLRSICLNVHKNIQFAVSH